jgi:hypothetical protein
VYRFADGTCKVSGRKNKYPYIEQRPLWEPLGDHWIAKIYPAGLCEFYYRNQLVIRNELHSRLEILEHRIEIPGETIVDYEVDKPKREEYYRKAYYVHLEN